MTSTLILSSDMRTSGTLSDATFRLDKRLRLKRGWKVIPSIMLPSLDNVYAARGNHIMTVNLNNNPTPTYTTITIEQGEYTTINSLLDVIRIALNAEALAHGTPTSYSCRYSTVTKRVTISHPSANFSFMVNTNDLLNFLGYAPGVYTGASSYTAAISSNMYPDICLVHTNLGNIERGSSGFLSIDPQYQLETVLFSAYVTEAGEKIFGDAGTRERPIFDKDFDIGTIRIWLTDLHNMPLSIQNAFVCKLTVMDPANSVGQ